MRPQRCESEPAPYFQGMTDFSFIYSISLCICKVIYIYIHVHMYICVYIYAHFFVFFSQPLDLAGSHLIRHGFLCCLHVQWQGHPSFCKTSMLHAYQTLSGHLDSIPKTTQRICLSHSKSCIQVSSPWKRSSAHCQLLLFVIRSHRFLNPRTRW